GAWALWATHTKRLYRFRPVVDVVIFLIPLHLLGGRVGAAVVTAIGLDGQVVHQHSHVGAVSLDDRREDLDQPLEARLLLFRGGRFRLVHRDVAVEAKRSNSFDHRFLGKQHSPDIGVLDDRRLFAGGPPGDV